MPIRVLGDAYETSTEDVGLAAGRTIDRARGDRAAKSTVFAVTIYCRAKCNVGQGGAARRAQSPGFDGQSGLADQRPALLDRRSRGAAHQCRRRWPQPPRGCGCIAARTETLSKLAVAGVGGLFGLGCFERSHACFAFRPWAAALRRSARLERLYGLSQLQRSTGKFFCKSTTFALVASFRLHNCSARSAGDVAAFALAESARGAKRGRDERIDSRFAFAKSCRSREREAPSSLGRRFVCSEQSGFVSGFGRET